MKNSHHRDTMTEDTIIPRITNMTFLARATTSILLLSLGYSLGLLSSSSSSSPPPSQTQLLIHLQPQLPNSTIAKPDDQLPRDLLRFRTQCADPVPNSQLHQLLLDNLYNGVSPYLGFPPHSTAQNLLPPSTNPRGWGSTTPVFAELIATVRPFTIIELGTFLGASALHMASITRNLSLSATLILCLDDFRGWPGARRLLRRDLPVPLHADALLLPQFMLAVQKAGETERVLPVPFSTSSALAALCEWGVYGDLIEVDAGHDFHSAWADINMAWAVLRPGGVMFGHDYFTKVDDMGVRRAVTLFAKVKGLQIQAHGQHWVLSPKPQNAQT